MSSPKKRNYKHIRTSVWDNSNVDETIKGANALFRLDYYDFIDWLVVDPMHCCWQGVMKLFLKLWFQDDYNSEKFSIRAKIQDFDRLLSACKLPMEINRQFRSYNIHGKYWKGTILNFITQN